MTLSAWAISPQSPGLWGVLLKKLSLCLPSSDKAKSWRCPTTCWAGDKPRLEAFVGDAVDRSLRSQNQLEMELGWNRGDMAAAATVGQAPPTTHVFSQLVLVTVLGGRD